MPEDERLRRRKTRDADSRRLPFMLRFIRRTISVTITFAILAGAAGLLTVLYLRSQALPAVTVTQTSKMYDIHGDVIETIFSGQNRQVVPLSEMSPYLIKAVISIEDHNFYSHMGLDPKGVARAVVKDIKTLSMEEGASTITQQLARNLYLNHDRTWSRKLREAFYAVQLELHLSKDQILQEYLNQIYFGHSTYGVEAAARMFFGKDAKDLSLAESALMAGVPKGPLYYSPYLNMQNAKDRQKIVLQAMVQQGYITQAEADQASQERLTILPRNTSQPSEAPYFQDYVKQVVTEKLGISDDAYEAGGLNIYTTLDLRAQKIAEEAITSKIPKESELQAALVAVDPRNGYIKAMVGGKDYKTNQFNRVLSTTRQPGSSFKPVVYLTALENGFSPMNKFKSEPTVFTYDNGRKTYAPSNYGNLYDNDYIDLRRAIMKSDNIYAVSTILDIGADKVIDMARRLGITSSLQPLPSLALGTYPVSPFEMASAFGVIANQGVRAEPMAVIRITDHAGKILYEAEPQTQKVIEPPYTYVLTNLMQSVFDEGGTGFRVSDIMKRPVAGKTGTTDTDAWMVGFTPELSTAVWIGYDKNKDIGTLDQRWAAPIFAQFTERTLESVPPKLFPVPDGVVSVYIDPASGKLANESCMKGSRVEVFVAGTEPTETCGASPASGQSGKKAAPETNGSWWQDLKRWWND